MRTAASVAPPSSGFIAPAGFTGTLTYTPTDVVSTLTANLGAGGSLSLNQATVINNFFNNGGTLPGAFVPVFALSGGSLANALSQLSGEAATDAERSGFQMMTEFLDLMLDPLVDGRLGRVSDLAMGFASDEGASLPADIALAYAGVLKAPPATFAQRWTAWGASFGGANSTNDNATVGSSNVTTGRVQTRHRVGGEVIIHPTSKAEHVEKPVLPRESSGFV